jgi:hypothetical protein
MYFGRAWINDFFKENWNLELILLEKIYYLNNLN